MNAVTGASGTGLPDVALPEGADPAELLAIAEKVAREAGALVRGRPVRVEVAATKSSPTDVVTEMDRASEALIRGRLADERPDDGLHGEEEGLLAGTSGITWVIDPIDGTVNYLYGIPAYSISVAAVVGDTRRAGAWRPVAGVVHNPVLDRTWAAAAGSGARLDGEALIVPDGPADLSAALVATGFGYRAARRASQARVLAGLLPRIRDIRRVGCASLDLCLLASGHVDAYYERGLQPWDVAAGFLVATEAGVAVRGIDGLPPGEHMVVAARPPLADVLAGELEAAGAGCDEPD
ncbi:MAG: monophosphatase [Actinomycetota bacterium]|nr:monophosphatase [Actinomycetota bacterium]